MGNPSNRHVRHLAFLLVCCLPLAGCCTEEDRDAASPSASSEASAAAAAASRGPYGRLIGTWRYDEPSREVLAAIERRSSSIQQRDRLTRAAHELPRVTWTFTSTHRVTRAGTGKPLKQRYEVLSTEEGTLRLRFHPDDGQGDSFDEAITFLGDDTLRHVIDGVPRTLHRE